MKKSGVEATKLYNDAQALLKKIINEKWLTAKSRVSGSAYSDGMITVTDELSMQVNLESLRQQIKLGAEGQPDMSLTDFIAPKKQAGRIIAGACRYY